ncbi:N(4)-acetylcytidine aminohydrolase [Moritella sp. Urea-trap-13]|uniref:N(4)-acetylcytidine aminohydrolase n=1 Tax=Moritella sp. Urea-trap-13 TaxID=2058327 RepID=UPI000C3297D5|nr:N(4)-acetylcytidine aminohydrolase [Moritella sp. Urea-trap-13]PKH06487.1 ASCH domain-containing protein [Moritella sp. Urea-trap-13]
MYSCITFFQRLKRSILSGSKTATIRDKSDSHYAVGQILDACTHEDNRKMCQIEILNIESVKFSELNRTHAKAENLPFVFILKWIVRKIYPTEDDLFFISFRVLSIG